MKKQGDSKRMLFEMMAKVNPGFILKEEVVEDYRIITSLSQPLTVEDADVVGEVLKNSYDVDKDVSDSIGHLRDGHSEDVNFNIYSDEFEKPLWDVFNVTRISGTLYVGVEYGEEQKGGLETEPLPAYWGAEVHLEKISFIDDDNKIIFQPPTNSADFKLINKEINDRFSSSDPNKYYEPRDDF